MFGGQTTCRGAGMTAGAVGVSTEGRLLGGAGAGAGGAAICGAGRLGWVRSVGATVGATSWGSSRPGFSTGVFIGR